MNTATGWLGSLLSIVTLAAAIMPVDAAAPPVSNGIPVAEIGEMTPNVRENSVIIRTNMASERARPGSRLYPGDLVKVIPCEDTLEVIYWLDDNAHTIRLQAPECTHLVQGSLPKGITRSLLDEILEVFQYLNEGPPPPRIYATYASRHLRTSESPEGFLAADRQQLLNVPQIVTADLGDLVAFWNTELPGPYDVAVLQDGITVATAQSEDALDATVHLGGRLRPGVPTDLTVSAAGKPVMVVPLTVVAGSGEPRAPEGTAAPSEDPETLTAHGLWLLLHGGPEWRLQALGRLAQSAAANGDFLAGRVLRSVIAAEWLPE